MNDAHLLTPVGLSNETRLAGWYEDALLDGVHVYTLLTEATALVLTRAPLEKLSACKVFGNRQEKCVSRAMRSSVDHNDKIQTLTSVRTFGRDILHC
jgi:hypothetical protein